MELDIAAEAIAARIDHGAEVIGAGTATGDAGEDDAEGAPILEPEGTAEAIAPAGGEGGFIGEGGSDPGADRGRAAHGEVDPAGGGSPAS